MSTNTNTPNIETSPLPIQISLGTSEGAIIGQSAADKISFYGKLPANIQKAGAVQASALASASGTAFTFGAGVSASNATATTWTRSAAQSASLTGTATIGPILAEIIDTLTGLGIWKGAA